MNTTDTIVPKRLKNGVIDVDAHEEGRAQQPGRSRMPTVLVADDAAFMRLRMSRILIEAGFRVLQAEHGADAVAKYKAHHPDAVLMDITMPQLDGLAALKQIREIDPDARVAMVTALGQQQLVLDCVKSGAKDFLVKPCDGERVIAAVTKLCA